MKDITSENVMPEDKENLQAAKDDLEKAMEDYGDNLTDEEKAALEKKIENIDNAMDSLEKAETVEDTITKLPDTVKPDDTDAGKLVNEAKEQYESLTEHEKSLVSDELQEKLESLLDALVDYEIVKGDGGKWEKGTKTGLSFMVNGACSKFTGIEIDGKPVDKDNYTVVSGSTIITLKAEYMETMSAGRHRLEVQYTDGKASCEFDVFSKDDIPAPGTGDSSNILLWITLLVVSGGMLGTATVKNKKRP